MVSVSKFGHHLEIEATDFHLCRLKIFKQEVVE